MRIVRFLLLFVGLASQKSPHPGGPRLDGQLCDNMVDSIGGIVVKNKFWQKSGGRDFKLFFITIVTQPSSQEAKNKWYFTLTQNFTKTVSHFLIVNGAQERQDAPINCDNSENSDKQCLLDPAKYFANMVFTLNFRVKLFGILKLVILILVFT